jgi:hypothetical protein
VRFSLLLGIFLIAGCVGPQAPAAVTAASTYKNPVYRDSQFKRVVVWAKAGLQARQELEAQTVKGLRRYGVDAVPSLDVWAIDSSEAEIKSKLEASGVDAVLALSVESESEITTAQYTTGVATRLFGTTFSEATTTAINEGRAVYTAALFSATSGRVAWQNQASSAGNELADWHNIRSSFADKTVHDLMDTEIVYKACVIGQNQPVRDPELSDAMNRRNVFRWQESLPALPAGQVYCPPKVQ